MVTDKPDDLVLIPDDRTLDAEGRRAVESVRWWEANGEKWPVLLVSAGELAKAGVVTDGDPADGGVNIATCEIALVPDHTKHWSPTDGFWHS